METRKKRRRKRNSSSDIDNYIPTDPMRYDTFIKDDIFTYNNAHDDNICISNGTFTKNWDSFNNTHLDVEVQHDDFVQQPLTRNHVYNISDNIPTNFNIQAPVFTTKYVTDKIQNVHLINKEKTPVVIDINNEKQPFPDDDINNEKQPITIDINKEKTPVPDDINKEKTPVPDDINKEKTPVTIDINKEDSDTELEIKTPPYCSLL